MWSQINTVPSIVAIQFSINYSPCFHILNTEHILISNPEMFQSHVYSSYQQCTILPARGMHESGRLGLGYFQQHSHGIHLVVGWLNLSQLYQGHPEGPDIGLVVIWTVLGCFAHYNLWGHPAKSDVSITYKATCGSQVKVCLHFWIVQVNSLYIWGAKIFFL